jgi:hypothetical protein
VLKGSILPDTSLCMGRHEHFSFTKVHEVVGLVAENNATMRIFQEFADRVMNFFYLNYFIKSTT